jgi:hypothetical protein
MHRARVLTRHLGTRRRYRSWIWIQEALGICFELIQAALTAEVVSLPFVVDVPDRIIGRDGHSANRVENLSRRDCCVIVGLG